VRYQAVAVMLQRIHVLWDMTLCRWVSGSRYFRGSWCCHLQGLCTM